MLPNLSTYCSFSLQPEGVYNMCIRLLRMESGWSNKRNDSSGCSINLGLLRVCILVKWREKYGWLHVMLPVIFWCFCCCVKLIDPVVFWIRTQCHHCWPLQANPMYINTAGLVRSIKVVRHKCSIFWSSTSVDAGFINERNYAPQFCFMTNRGRSKSHRATDAKQLLLICNSHVVIHDYIAITCTEQHYFQQKNIAVQVYQWRWHTKSK